MESDNAVHMNRDAVLQAIRDAIDIHERLRASVVEEYACLMNDDFGRAAGIRRERIQIEREYASVMGMIRNISDVVGNGSAGTDASKLMDRLRESVKMTAEEVQLRISDYERERGDMAKKLGVLRTSKRAFKAYAQFGSTH